MSEIAMTQATNSVLEATQRATEDAVLDRTLFVVDSDTFETVGARFDEVPHPNENLRRTLVMPAPWE